MACLPKLARSQIVYGTMWLLSALRQGFFADCRTIVFVNEERCGIRLDRRMRYRVSGIETKTHDEMQRHGIVEPAASPWASNVVLVKKKDGSLRFCVDYRKLNSVTYKDSYPLPLIDNCLNALSGSSWYSTLDLRSGYYNIPIAEEDRDKSAFSTENIHFS